MPVLKTQKWGWEVARRIDGAGARSAMLRNHRHPRAAAEALKTAPARLHRPSPGSPWSRRRAGRRRTRSSKAGAAPRRQDSKHRATVIGKLGRGAALPARGASHRQTEDGAASGGGRGRATWSSPARRALPDPAWAPSSRTLGRTGWKGGWRSGLRAGQRGSREGRRRAGAGGAQLAHPEFPRESGRARSICFRPGGHQPLPRA